MLDTLRYTERKLILNLTANQYFLRHNAFDIVYQYSSKVINKKEKKSYIIHD